MSRRRSFCGLFLVIGVLLAAGARADDNSCIGCHQRPDFFAEYPKLYSYYQRWLGSPHEQAGLTCDDCHGGRPDEATARRAHRGVLPMSSRHSSLHAMRQPETCGTCHRDKIRQFVKSRHYEALMGERAAPTCATCHPAMSQRPELRVIVLNACRTCHRPGNVGNLPLIADKAEQVFNQLNIASGLMGWVRIHFESHDWPEDSRSQVEALERRYGEIVSRVHNFDLGRTEMDTVELLGELREMFNRARSEHQGAAEKS